MFEGLAGLTVVRDSGVSDGRAKDWVITLKSDHPHSFRITAHDDGYKNQSYLRFEKLTPGGWFTVVSRRGDELPLGGSTAMWAEQMGAEIEDLTLEACRLLDILGDEA